MKLPGTRTRSKEAGRQTDRVPPVVRAVLLASLGLAVVFLATVWIWRMVVPADKPSATGQAQVPAAPAKTR